MSDQHRLVIELGTTGDQDREAKDLIEETFKAACEEAEMEGCPFCGKRFRVVAALDLDVLWEKLMAVIGVTV